MSLSDNELPKIVAKPEPRDSTAALFGAEMIKLASRHSLGGLGRDESMSVSVSDEDQIVGANPMPATPQSGQFEDSIADFIATDIKFTAEVLAKQKTEPDRDRGVEENIDNVNFEEMEFEQEFQSGGNLYGDVELFASDFMSPNIAVASGTIRKRAKVDIDNLLDGLVVNKFATQLSDSMIDYITTKYELQSFQKLDRVAFLRAIKTDHFDWLALIEKYFYPPFTRLFDRIIQISRKIYIMRELIQHQRIIYLPDTEAQIETMAQTAANPTVRMMTTRIGRFDTGDFKMEMGRIGEDIEDEPPEFAPPQTQDLTKSNKPKLAPSQSSKQTANHLKTFVMEPFGKEDGTVDLYALMHPDGHGRSKSKMSMSVKRTEIPLRNFSSIEGTVMAGAMNSQFVRNREFDGAKVQCHGCLGWIRPTKSDRSALEYVIPAMTGVSVFFHDDACVELRKYKEVIRKYIAQEAADDERDSDRSHRQTTLQYIKFLTRNFEILITLNSGKLPRPTGVNETSDGVGYLHRFASKLGIGDTSSFMAGHASLGKKNSSQGGSGGNSGMRLLTNTETLREEIIRDRRLAVALIKREQLVQKLKDDNKTWRFDDIPPQLQYANMGIYGVPLWIFVAQQLLSKQYDTLWKLLAYISMGLPTVTALHLLEENRSELSKVKDMKHLYVVCASIIESSAFPIATALHMCAYMNSCAENDLSRAAEFEEMCDSFSNVAEELVNSVESDHLLGILLETPTDLDQMSVFEIAIKYELADFFDSNRVGRVCSHMWSEIDFLNPKHMFRAKDIEIDEMLTFLAQNPNEFYYCPIGRYWSSSFMYLGYLILVTTVNYNLCYPYLSMGTIEAWMWVFNCGYVQFEILEMIFRGGAYFTDVSNYFDMLIVTNWGILAFIRFFGEVFLSGYTDAGYWGGEETWEGDSNVTGTRETISAYNNNIITVIYMTVFAIQTVILWSRVASIFKRTRNVGPFIGMIGGMISDVFNFILVLSIFYTGFVFALNFIVANDITEGCGSEEENSELSTIFLYIFQTLMGQQEWSKLNNNGSCFLGNRAMVAKALIFIFSLMGTVLLLNLLIAMMSSTYDTKRESKTKEINFARLSDTYEWAHSAAVISPPLNIVANILCLVWFLWEAIFVLLSCGRYIINIKSLIPLTISYVDEAMHKGAPKRHRMEGDLCGGFIRRRPERCVSLDEIRHGDNTYCRFCRTQMDQSGSISDYISLFKTYKLDRDDTLLMSRLCGGRGLCPKCFRPYVKGAEGKSDRLSRWQVTLEVISFYVFMFFLYIPLLLSLFFPASLTRIFSSIVNMATSTSVQSITPQSQIPKPDEEYRMLVRDVIKDNETTDSKDVSDKIEELTSKFVKLEQTQFRSEEAILQIVASLGAIRKSLAKIERNSDMAVTQQQPSAQRQLQQRSRRNAGMPQRSKSGRQAPVTPIVTGDAPISSTIDAATGVCGMPLPGGGLAAIDSGEAEAKSDPAVVFSNVNDYFENQRNEQA